MTLAMCRKPTCPIPNQQAQQALLDGTCAFYAQGDWVVGELEKIDADKTASSIGAFLIPLADHLYCGVGVNKGFYVSKNGKNPELAQKVMEALVAPEAQQALDLFCKFEPAKQGDCHFVAVIDADACDDIMEQLFVERLQRLFQLIDQGFQVPHILQHRRDP